MEMWKDIPGYEGYYKVSNKGNIWSERRRRNLKASLNVHGYLKVMLVNRNKIRKWHMVHILVLKSFKPKNLFDGSDCNHMDGTKTNCDIKNLEWCTKSENQLHSHRVLNNNRHAGKRPVIQLDKSGNIIATFNSINEASKITGANAPSIIDVCNGKLNTTHGFVWKDAA